MCDSVRLLNGPDILSVRQFETFFGVDPDNLKYEEDDELDMDCCLCQIKLEEFMEDKPNFYYEDGEWWEKPIEK